MFSFVAYFMQESSVCYVVGRTLHGELLRDVPDNVVDTKLFVLKDHNIVCHSFIFSGRDKSGTNISGLSLILPISELKNYLPLVELAEERIKILIAKLRVLQAKVSFITVMKVLLFKNGKCVVRRYRVMEKVCL